MVWPFQNWVRSYDLLEFLKGLGAFVSPDEWFALLGKLGDRLDNLSIPQNERSIIPKGTQSRSNFVHILKYLMPFCKPVEFCGINLQLFPLYSDP